jgi:antitoxin (DNA-binding transcriptional repressor) of toxin-antitoxin stability system
MGRRKTTASNKRGLYEVSAEDPPVVAESEASLRERGARVVSATEAARRFSDLINRVGYKGETYIIERGGRPMCELSPVDPHRFTGEDLLALLAILPRPDEEFLDIVEELTSNQPRTESSPWES